MLCGVTAIKAVHELTSQGSCQPIYDLLVLRTGYRIDFFSPCHQMSPSTVTDSVYEKNKAK